MRRSCGLGAMAGQEDFAPPEPCSIRNASDQLFAGWTAPRRLLHNFGTRTRRIMASMISKQPNAKRPSAAIASKTPPYV
jgi:hypothetical protein